MIDISDGKILKDVKIITPEVFYDYRGSYVETYNKKEYSILKDFNNVSLEFVQDDISVSSKHVLRGLHGDQKTWKLIQCLKGSIYVAIVDMRVDSKSYLQSETFSISEQNRKQILVPAGFANGHLCMSNTCIFSYKQTTYYEGKEKQFTVKWDDPLINIRWPIKDPVLSTRDSTAKYLEEK